MRLAALALALAGCDVVAGLDEVPTADLGPGCSSTRLVKSFGDGTLDPLWQLYLGNMTTLDITPDVLTITSNSSDRTAIVTVTNFDIRNDSVSVGVTISDPANGTAQLVLYDSVDQQNQLELYTQTGTLHFTIHTDTTMTDIGTMLFDPVAHRYWRIAQVGDETHWDTSPDDKTWTTRATARLGWVHYVAVTLAEGGPGTNYTASFDHLNSGAPAGVVCRATAIVDDFHADTLSDVWVQSQTFGTIAPSGGQLVATLDATGFNGLVVVNSATVYDLQANAFYVHVIDTPDASIDATVELNVNTLPANTVGLQSSRGVVTARAKNGDLATHPWDETATSWWRLRGAGDTLHFEISGDGRHYTELAQLSGLQLDRASVALVLVGSAPHTAMFDNFNVPP